MPTPNKQPIKPHSVWLCVFEVVGTKVPRRFPDKPHIRVEQKAIKPGDELNAWLQRAQAKKRPELVRVLYALMPAERDPGGLLNPFEAPRDQAEIKNALRKLRDTLRCKRYTIGDNTTVWNVYAIELNDDHLAKKPEGYMGHVYVGQTSLPVADRIEQHRLGKKYPWKGRPKHSAYCHKHFRKPALELVPDHLRGPIPCQRKSLWFERDLRKFLEERGYKVEGATEMLPKKPRKPPGKA